MNALRALAPPPLRPVPSPSRPQPRTPTPRWSRRHSYIAQGEYRVTVRGLGLIRSIGDIENIVVSAQKGTPVRVRDIGTVAVGTAIRLGVLGRDHADDLVQGIVLMRKGENPDAVIQGVARKIEQLKKTLPAGVDLRDYYSRDRLVKTTVTTVMRNLIEGAALVVVLLSLFLYNIRAALIVAVTIPLSLLFAFIFMDLRGIPANLLSLGAIASNSRLHVLVASPLSNAYCRELCETAGENVTVTKHGFEASRTDQKVRELRSWWLTLIVRVLSVFLRLRVHTGHGAR